MIHEILLKGQYFRTIYNIYIRTNGNLNHIILLLHLLDRQRIFAMNINICHTFSAINVVTLQSQNGIILKKRTQNSFIMFYVEVFSH